MDQIEKMDALIIAVEHKKYTNLDEKQKGLLKEYINNMSNTSKFKDYLKIVLSQVWIKIEVKKI